MNYDPDREVPGKIGGMNPWPIALWISAGIYLVIGGIMLRIYGVI